VIRSRGFQFSLVVFAIELLARVALILTYPDNYSMDAYQRWGGREHLLIQDWLPATQSLIWIVDTLGGGIFMMRIVMAIVAALAVTAGAWVARHLGGAAAGWLFIPIGLFGPFLTWSVVPYQEGMFLLGTFGALALALEANSRGLDRTAPMWMIADITAGLIPLVRYEGWPVTILYIIWRRDPRACVALWGAALWVTLKTIGIESHASSPVNFADWEGISTRFDPQILSSTLGRLWRHMLDTKGIALLVTGIVAWIHLIRRSRPSSLLLGLIFAGQLAALFGWLIGLETATYRMQAIPGVLLGLFVAASGGILWEQKRWPIRSFIAIVAVFAAIAFVQQGFNNAYRSTRSVRWEARLVQEMEGCTDCRYLIKPRKGLGTRNRHDGCEIIQGLGTSLHGDQFWCQLWGTVPDDFEATHAARWRKGGYVIRDARKQDLENK
jgi:hypothetical protein